MNEKRKTGKTSDSILRQHTESLIPGLNLFPADGRHAILPLDAIWDIVEEIKPAWRHPAVIEFNGRLWLLRVTFRNGHHTIRRSLALPSTEVAMQVSKRMHEFREQLEYEKNKLRWHIATGTPCDTAVPFECPTLSARKTTVAMDKTEAIAVKEMV